MPLFLKYSPLTPTYLPTTLLPLPLPLLKSRQVLLRAFRRERRHVPRVTAQGCTLSSPQAAPFPGLTHLRSCFPNDGNTQWSSK